LLVAVLAVLPPSARAQTFSVLASFGVGQPASITAGNLQDGGGYLGTTYSNNANDGSIYRLADEDGQWTMKGLFGFTGLDGKSPQGINNFGYGTTYYGGTGDGGAGLGTVFYFNFSTLALEATYSFCQQANCADGSFPASAPLDQGYGTTWGGGASGGGVLYQFNPSNGTETVLHSFVPSSDGGYPTGLAIPPLLGYNGTVYGATGSSGSSGKGTVYEFDVNTNAYTELYSFKGATDGAFPQGVVLDQNGNIYGTTLEGGTFGYGTVFKITPAGVKSTLYNFQGLADGANPRGSPVIDLNNGNLYGVASAGAGAENPGTLFQITPSGVFSVVHTFCSSPGCADGRGPTEVASLGGAGLIGITTAGGESNLGIAFRLLY
jgi:uncharacterized repeat protein (TIGR03803 family)